MHLFTLVAFLTLAGSPTRPIPAGCSEDYGTCREDCTIEFGGSTTKYRQLGECLRSCDKAQTECTRQHYALRDALPEPTPSSSSSTASSDSPSVPASSTRPTPSSGRQGVYRASEAEPARPPEPPAPPPAPVEPPVKKEPEPVAAPEPKPQPAAKPRPAPEPEKWEMRTFDDDEPEPAPAPKPAPKPIEPPRSQPPPEPKKKDISEWDPNAD